jgi:hypothetical protein
MAPMLRLRHSEIIVHKSRFEFAKGRLLVRFPSLNFATSKLASS